MLPDPQRIEISVIHFTKRVARRCSRPGSQVPDWVVCDAVAHGSRTSVGRRGAQGGRLIRFERTFSGTQGGEAFTVRVLGELTEAGCFALKLLLPARIPEKIWDKSGFLNRAGSK
jgi:hypothetical protein